MKIELKNVKHSEFASQETDCFQASIYVDGKKRGMAENGGYGGCTMISPNELAREIQAYAITLPPHESKYGTIPMDAEMLIGDLLTDHLIARDLKRAMAKKVLFVKDDGHLYESKITIPIDLSTPEKRSSLLNMFTTRSKATHVLNIMPFGEALSIYRAGGVHV
jgi:hypothetical protein